ncbi:hypothetical protein SLG_18550 [Sphingobium sp. SYK-6]|uniref:hypothetical protein n=1 Tax=Sphingobium sp. (strain NBRC 103272 / SYK-6) TaxID=627192 RepID=UPI00022773C0|nr:hypothetical protein [Sphingobium sp. SYK-6]BAK66530.1 hypothetical protein SLG_18550 [Sphingobium sp. SYK-6]
MLRRLIPLARMLMGAIYLINGLNWWVKMISPYPSMSDFVNMPPPPDVVGAMIQNGILFHLVKATEVAAGLALLSNRFVPLALVSVLPVTFPIFIVDVFFIAHLRGMVMGGGSLLLNLFLLLAYLGHYRPLLSSRGVLDLEGNAATIDDSASIASPLAKLFRPAMPMLAILAVATGLLMLGWLTILIGQYITNPLPLSAVIPARDH